MTLIQHLATAAVAATHPFHCQWIEYEKLIHSYQTIQTRVIKSMSIEGCRHSNNEQHHYHSNIYSFQYEMLHIQHTLKKHVIKILSLYRNVTCCLDTMMGVLSCCNNRTI